MYTLNFSSAVPSYCFSLKTLASTLYAVNLSQNLTKNFLGLIDSGLSFPIRVGDVIASFCISRCSMIEIMPFSSCCIMSSCLGFFSELTDLNSGIPEILTSHVLSSSELFCFNSAEM